MPYRTVVSLTAATVLAFAAVSSQALAFRGGVHGVHGGVHGGGVYHGGAYHGGHYHSGAYAYRGGAYHGRYWRPGVATGAAVGAAAVGAAIAAPSYYNSTACGYDPYPPCY